MRICFPDGCVARCLSTLFFFFSSRRRHTRFDCDWSSDVCSSDLVPQAFSERAALFAVTYTGVRLLHLGLYTYASRRGHASWAAIAGFGTATLEIGRAHV